MFSYTTHKQYRKIDFLFYLVYHDVYNFMFTSEYFILTEILFSVDLNRTKTCDFDVRLRLLIYQSSGHENLTEKVNIE